MTNLNKLSLGAPLTHGTAIVIKKLEVEDKIKLLEEKVYELTEIINKLKTTNINNDHIISNQQRDPVGIIHERENDFFTGTQYKLIPDACESINFRG